MTVCYCKVWFTRTGNLAITNDSGFLRPLGTVVHRLLWFCFLAGRLLAIGLAALAQTLDVANLVLD